MDRRGHWAGVAGATLLAVFGEQISSALAGIGQELFNAGVLAVAVFMLAWHNIWMARHGRELAAQMKEVGDAVAKGSRSLAAVAIVVAVAVLREGSEILLFLYGFLAAGLAAQSVVFLQQAGIATVLEGTVWDTSAILSDTSLLGRVLHTLIGYTDQPSGLLLVVYALTLVIIFGLTKAFGLPQPTKRPAVVR